MGRGCQALVQPALQLMVNPKVAEDPQARCIKTAAFRRKCKTEDLSVMNMLLARIELEVNWNRPELVVVPFRKSASRPALEDQQEFSTVAALASAAAVVAVRRPPTAALIPVAVVTAVAAVRRLPPPPATQPWEEHPMVSYLPGTPRSSPRFSRWFIDQ